MEMLFSTSLVALVLAPRLLRILNTKVSWQYWVPTVADIATERYHDSRTYFSYEDLSCEDESQTASSSFGRVNLSV